MPRLLLSIALVVSASWPAVAAEPDPPRGLPLLFEANGGRYDPSVRFVARGPGYTLMLAPGGTALLLERTVAEADGHRRAVHAAAVRATFVGAAAEPAVSGLDPAPTRVHHLRGADPSGWSVGNATFTRVGYSGVWPGIDLVLYDAGGQLEYDFVVAPGGDPGLIRLAYEGVDDLSIREDGALVLETPAGPLVHSPPVVFQGSGPARTAVSGRFRLLDGGVVGFDVDAWDTSRPLVIDPVLVYAGLIGGELADIVHDVAADASGRAYVVGETLSADLPVTAGALDTTLSDRDVFVARVAPDGTSLEWCTYLGGTDPAYTTNADDFGYAVEVGPSGLVHVAGQTTCKDFPTTAGAIKASQPSWGDAFVSLLAADGASLVYSTLLGGTLLDVAYDLDVADTGRVYVTGQTDTSGFPITSGAFQSTGSPRVAFFAWFTPGGPLEYGSYLGGGANWDYGYAIEVDASGRVYVGGVTYAGDFPTTAGGFQPGHGGNVDGFVCRFDPSGSVMEYGTLLGGPNNDMADSYLDLAVADDGRVWAVGTAREGYPTSPGAFQVTSPTLSPETFGAGVLTCLDTDLSGAASMVFSTFFGSWSPSGLSDVEVDGSGNAWAFGWADGADFPVLNAWDDDLGYGTGNDLTDAVLACFDASGALLNSSFVGGSGLEPNQFAPASHGGFELGPDGTLFLSQTQSAGGVGLPTPGALQDIGAGGTDSWVARFLPDDPACQADYGFDGPGDGVLSLCGGDLSSGTYAVLRLSGFDPGLVYVVLGLTADPAYVFKLDATLVPLPILATVPLTADGAGELELYVPGGFGPLTLYVQATQPDNPDPGDWTTSNAIEACFQP